MRTFIKSKPSSPLTSTRLTVGACLIVAATILTACGDGGRTADPVANTPAPVAATPASNEVPATASDSPAAFFAYVKALAASGDESSEPLSLPALKDAGDDGAEPQLVGA
jgi:hypothetical protein